MKGLKVMLLTTVVVLLAMAVTYAAAPSVNIGVTAQVPNNSPQLDVIIKELTQAGQNPWTGTTINEMSFGQLTHTLADGTDAGVWYSAKYLCVFIYKIGRASCRERV